MLVHVSADRKNASVVTHPPRHPGRHPGVQGPESGKAYPATDAIINESLARGGPGCTVATWEKLTGIYIDHWMMIDFSGVVPMARRDRRRHGLREGQRLDRRAPGSPAAPG